MENNKETRDREMENEMNTIIIRLESENRILKRILEQLLNIELIPKLKL